MATSSVRNARATSTRPELNASRKATTVATMRACCADVTKVKGGGVALGGPLTAGAVEAEGDAELASAAGGVLAPVGAPTHPLSRASVSAASARTLTNPFTDSGARRFPADLRRASLPRSGGLDDAKRLADAAGPWRAVSGEHQGRFNAAEPRERR